MAIIRSKFPLIFPKFGVKPFSPSFCTIVEASQKTNPNFSDNDDESGEVDAEISSNLSPQDTLIAEKFHSFIKDNFRINPYFIPNPNPESAISDHHSLVFSRVAAGESVSPSVVVSVIEKCRAVRRGIPLAEALAFFNWAVGQCDNVDSYKQGFVEMVDLVGKVQAFDLAWGLIDDMKCRKIDIPSELFVRLIRRYVRAGMVAEALHVFNRMEEFGCSPDNAVFTAVLTILVKKKKAVEAQSFFDGLKDRFEPDVVVYTSLVNGWCRVGDIAEAEKVFGEMKRNGIEPNVYTYSIVIDGLCRQGLITRAHDVFSEMIEKGCQPNAATFNNLMRVHVKAGRTEKVLQVYNQMKRLGCQPDVITFNFLIDCHCKDGNRDEAMKLIQLMTNKGLAPNVHSFNPIFHSISESRDVNAAHRLFAKMKELKCQPNTVTYNVLMRMFVTSKSTDMVLTLKKEMDELEVEPNINTYKVLITMFCAMGHWSNARKYFKEMVQEKNLRPNKHMYEMVLTQLRISGQIKKHEELVEMMVARGFAARPI